MSPTKKQVLRSSENVAKKSSNSRDVTRKIKQSSGYASHHYPIVLKSSPYRHHYHHPHPHPHPHEYPFSYYHHGQHQYYQHQPHHQTYHQPQPRPTKAPTPKVKLEDDDKNGSPTLTSESSPPPPPRTESVQQQPKPPRSAFMCFKDHKRKEILKKEGISEDKDDLLKVFASAWKNLSQEEKAYWDEEARNDKVRFIQEKNLYKGPWNLPKRRAKKHPEAPKRPMSAFLKFSKTRRKTVRDQNPDVSNTDVSRLLGEIWRNSSDAVKKPFIEAELIERKKYKLVMKKWREDQAQLDAAARTSHEEAAQIFRESQHQQRKSTNHHAHHYFSTFDRYRENTATIGAHVEPFNSDPLLEEEPSKRSAFAPHATNPYHRSQLPVHDYFSSDSPRQASWPELSLEHSMDHDSDPLPVVPTMPPPLQFPKNGSGTDEYIGGHPSHRSIYFPENPPNFPRFP